MAEDLRVKIVKFESFIHDMLTRTTYDNCLNFVSMNNITQLQDLIRRVLTAIYGNNLDYHGSDDIKKLQEKVYEVLFNASLKAFKGTWWIFISYNGRPVDVPLEYDNFYGPFKTEAEAIKCVDDMRWAEKERQAESEKWCGE